MAYEAFREYLPDNINLGWAVRQRTFYRGGEIRGGIVAWLPIEDDAKQHATKLNKRGGVTKSDNA